MMDSIAGYDVIEFVAQDEFGPTYLASYGEARTLVYLHVTERPVGGEARQRLASVFERLAPVSEPNLVRIVDCGFSEEIAYFAEENDGSVTLASLLETNGRTTWTLAALVAHETARALEALAQRRLAHGFVDPQRVRLLQEGRVRVASVGLGEMLVALGALESSTEDLLRRDVRSIAAIAYEMAYGKPLEFTPGQPLAFDPTVAVPNAFRDFIATTLALPAHSDTLTDVRRRVAALLDEAGIADIEAALRKAFGELSFFFLLSKTWSGADVAVESVGDSVPMEATGAPVPATTQVDAATEEEGAARAETGDVMSPRSGEPPAEQDDRIDVIDLQALVDEGLGTDGDHGGVFDELDLGEDAAGRESTSPKLGILPIAESVEFSADHEEATQLDDETPVTNPLDDVPPTLEPLRELDDLPVRPPTEPQPLPRWAREPAAPPDATPARGRGGAKRAGVLFVLVLLVATAAWVWLGSKEAKRVAKERAARAAQARAQAERRDTPHVDAKVKAQRALDEALARAAKMLEDDQTAEAIASLQALRTQHPREARVVVLLGKALLAAGRPKDAVALLEPWVLEVGGPADAYDLLGQALLALDRPEEAAAALSKARSEKARDPDFLRRLARAFIRAGRGEDAVPVLLQLRRLEPKAVDAEVALGHVYEMQRNYTEAVRHYARAVELAPDMEVVFWRMIRVYRRLGKLKEARHRVARFLEDHPDNPAGLLFVASIDYGARKWKAAQRGLLRYLELEPDDWVGWMGLGAVHYRLHRYDEAFDAWKKALAHKPEDSRIEHNLGEADLLRHRLPGAIEWFTRAAAHQPPVWQPLCELAKIRLAQRKVRQARELFVKAAARAPGHPWLGTVVRVPLDSAPARVELTKPCWVNQIFDDLVELNGKIAEEAPHAAQR